MNIICYQKTLLQAVNNAQKAINNKSTSESLKGIYLSGDENTVTVCGCDTDITIKTVIDAKVKTPGEIIVNARLFGDIVRRLTDEFITIETDADYNIFINGKSSRFKIKGMSAVDYPKAQEINPHSFIKMNQLELKTMIRQTVFATTTNSSTTTMAGELVEVDGEVVTMVAVDGYRLAVRKSNLDQPSVDSLRAVVPAVTLNQLNSMLMDDGDILIGVDDKNIVFKLNNTTIVGKTLEGRFSRYESLLPKEFQTRIEVNTKELHNALERASLLATSSNDYKLVISINEKMMYLTSNNETGNAYEELEIEFEGEPLVIGVNSKYFLEGIKNVDSEKLCIEFSSPVNPYIVTPMSGPEYIYLMLPVKV